MSEDEIIEIVKRVCGAMISEHLSNQAPATVSTSSAPAQQNVVCRNICKRGPPGPPGERGYPGPRGELVSHILHILTQLKP